MLMRDWLLMRGLCLLRSRGGTKPGLKLFAGLQGEMGQWHGRLPGWCRTQEAPEPPRTQPGPKAPQTPLGSDPSPEPSLDLKHLKPNWDREHPPNPAGTRTILKTSLDLKHLKPG